MCFHLRGPAGIAAQVADVLLGAFAEAELEIRAKPSSLTLAVLHGDEAVARQRCKVLGAEAETAQRIRSAKIGGDSHGAHRRWLLRKRRSRVIAPKRRLS